MLVFERKFAVPERIYQFETNESKIKVVSKSFVNKAKKQTVVFLSMLLAYIRCYFIRKLLAEKDKRRS